MNALWAPCALAVIVAALLRAASLPRLQPLFRWLPVPLWCYLLPVIAVELGALPSVDPGASFSIYRALADLLLPLALSLLLLGIDVRAILRTGARALAAAVAGAFGIAIGALSGVWLFRASLPSDAWQGAGALTGTWTGGTMNLLALRAALSIPDPVFAPLILVDAFIAYGWMAVLVALSGCQRPFNRWLRATAPGNPAQRGGRAPSATALGIPLPPGGHSRSPACPGPDVGRVGGAAGGGTTGSPGWRVVALSLLCAVVVAFVAHGLAGSLPTTSMITSQMGWTVVLVTTIALALSLSAPIRRIGRSGDRLGYPALYLVLAATGAQTSLEALRGAQIWMLVGIWTVLVHGGLLVLSGRLLRIPLGVLATASQANLGGMVSGPLVGAVYHRELAPVGLLLAIGGNAFGTYLGLACAATARWLLPAG